MTDIPGVAAPPADLLAEVERLAKALDDELVALRRDLHAHPELGRAEVRTTRVVRDRLEAAGLRPRVLESGTGLVCDLPGPADGPVLALRADIDALSVVDAKDVPYRSTVPGVCHACGHDVHTAVVLGAGLVLAELAGRGVLGVPVRLVFQPAEEVMPGGSHDVIAAGGIEGVGRILCVHCDPRLDAGMVGLREGPVTSACDRLVVSLSGRGGHTARPHLTDDLVYALGTLVTELPATLSRRLDPRAGVSLVWGRVGAGHAANAIPARGEAEGTIRMLDAGAWTDTPDLIHELVREVLAPYGVSAEVRVHRGVPPVVNDSGTTELFRVAAEAALGVESVTTTDQSLGAEDFAWYLEHVPGALARLGVRRPGDTRVRDLHQGDFDPDERAISVGVRLLVAAVLALP
ncbi:MAG TPA: amidohydrolase [Jiangellales bacterium]|nr:amidohydrolase [Jiangellales bacterium]